MVLTITHTEDIMVFVQLIDNGAAKFPMEFCKSPQELKKIFNLARDKKYTVTIVRGWEYAWVQNAWQNWQEELETAQ
jgi:hypothetical protein